MFTFINVLKKLLYLMGYTFSKYEYGLNVMTKFARKGSYDEKKVLQIPIHKQFSCIEKKFQI